MKIFDQLSDYVDSNKSTLLTGAGIGLGILSTVLAIQATKKVTKRLEEAGEDISKKEKVKIYLKEYSGVIAAEIGAIGCILSGKSMDLKDISKLTVVSESATGFVKAYSENVEKQIGKEKNEELKQKARVESSPNVKLKASEMVSLLDGDQYFLEPYSGKIFASSSTKIENAINIFNNRMNCNDDAPLYDLWEAIVDQTPCELNKTLLDGQINQTLGFAVKNGLIAVRYWDPETRTVNGNKVSFIPITFIDQKSGVDRDPLERFEEGRCM